MTCSAEFSQESFEDGVPSLHSSTEDGEGPPRSSNFFRTLVVTCVFPALLPDTACFLHFKQGGSRT